MPSLPGNVPSAESRTGNAARSWLPQFFVNTLILGDFAIALLVVMLVHVQPPEITSMLQRKFWLHYHTLRFIVELVATLGTAALFSYWILTNYR